jgi:hypothetical protein
MTPVVSLDPYTGGQRKANVGAPDGIERRKA